MPRMIELARRSWLSAFAETAPQALVAYWRTNDREPGWHAKYWDSMTVAELGGDVVALVQPSANEVNGLWVDPAAQGAGIGLLLLREAERQIRAAGFVGAWLDCSGYNARALRFYQRAGYHEIRRRVYEVVYGVTNEAIILERRFDTSADERAERLRATRRRACRLRHAILHSS